MTRSQWIVVLCVSTRSQVVVFRSGYYSGLETHSPKPKKEAIFMGIWRRITFWAVAASVLVLVSAAPATAQQRGIVTGTVADVATGQTLESAQVYLPGLAMGALTNPAGRFLILDVPVGTHEISVQLIGYSSGSQNVTVVAGEPIEVTFELTTTALRLQELVVTGVAGETPRVKLPFTVEKLNFEDIKVPPPSAEGLITGKVAGAKVQKSSGQPGTDANIMLRGPTTITGSQDPLIIIDGVITDNTLADIGSLDVESIEIIKGAAGASLYGSRAQNGVVQIRTKRGQDLRVDQSRLIFRTEYGKQAIQGSTPITKAHWFETDAAGNILDVEGNIVTDLNTHKEITGINVSETIWHDKKYPSSMKLYDHLEQLFQPGRYMSEYAAVEGRTGSTNYRASFTYQDEQGVIPDFNSGARLKGFRLNVDHQVRENLSIGLSTYYAKSDQEDLGGSPFYALAFQNPFVDLLRRDPATIGLPHCPKEGCLVNVPDPFNQEENPLYSLELLDRFDDRSRFLGSADLVWSPLTWFELEGNFSMDRSDYFQSNITPRGYETEQSISTGSIQKSQSISSDINASVTAAFNKAFGDLTTRTRLRYLMEDQHSEYFSVTGRETLAYGVPVLDNAATYDGGSSIQDVRSEGYFFISALDFKGKYIGDVLVRRDGSSLFGPEQRWQTYYRASGAWRIAQEDWWPFEAIDEFKLRYSIGTAGGRPGFSWQYETYSVSSSGIFPRSLGNKNLKPELTTEQEAGLEMVLFDKVSTGLIYAWSRTEDQLLSQPLLAPVGFNSQRVNAGEIESNTIEMYVETALIDRPDMTWTSRLNFDRTNQEITKLDIPAYRSGRQYIRAGESMGTFYGSLWATRCNQLAAGMDCSQFQVNDDGLLVWVGPGNSWNEGISKNLWFTSSPDFTDADGNIRSYDWGRPIKALGLDVTENETIFLPMGNSTPDFNLSFGNTIRWKNLSLYTLLDGEFGADVYNQTRGYGYRDETSGDQDQSNKADANKKPIIYYQDLYNVNAASSWFVEDGTFVKLREVALRYTFDPAQVQSWFGALGLDGLSFNVIGRNLHTWTDYQGYDPEAGGIISRADDFGYPQFRTLSVSIETIF